MALLLCAGGSLAQHRRGAAPGLPASTQDRGQTYASLPQATQPLLLPPTPRTPGAKHPPSHVRYLDTPLKAVLDGPADLLRLEVHGPKAENDKLKEALGPLGCVFYNTEWGFRNAV